MNIPQSESEKFLLEKLKQLFGKEPAENITAELQDILIDLKKQRMEEILDRDDKLQQYKKEEDEAAESYFEIYRDLSQAQIDIIESFMLTRDCTMERTSDLCYARGVLDGLRFFISGLY
ncbi:hypothetical protein [Diplocloster modestus]|uniref:Uncharacterized protein n=1 Tax=Diplocloster modestus TaxID=2850322 RepID=A0ABS6K5N5_9FIRM|nr:hypothetical protein [Diplocloster modestus]MBU9725813.1 hypothetical protein [Diplocloster modestus]